MSVAVLLRLVAEALAEGRVAGHAEVVETGATAVFKDQAEMVAFLRRAIGAEPARDGDQVGWGVSPPEAEITAEA